MRPSYTQLQQKVENYGNYDRFPLGFRYPFAANTRDVVSVSRQSRVLTTSRLGLVSVSGYFISLVKTFCAECEQ